MKSAPIMVHGRVDLGGRRILRKTLESFSGGKGEILALITLQ
jgi:hypothetical protein